MYNAAMQQVATSELRANLSEWIKRVREGEEVVVTDRGMPVVRLLAIDAESAMERLVREGVISRPKSTDRPIASGRVRPRVSRPVSDIVSEQRGE
jgi:prevent-host-death family protein